MLDELKNFVPDRVSVEELVALSAFGRQLTVEYTELQVEQPEWLETQTKAVARELRAKLADHYAARRRELKARLETLKTPTEKREALTKELEALDAAAAKIGA